jgi:ribonuclease Z
MELVFLGTSSSFPTKNRNHPAVLLKHTKESILFDCGEGTQRQIRIAKENPMRITKICITHWHGDHSLGLPGLLASYGMNQRKLPLKIFGPRNTKKNIDLFSKAFNVYYQFKLTSKDLTAKKLKVIEDTEDYQISAINVDHRIPCLGYSFEIKPKVKINKAFLKKHKISSSPKLKQLKQGKTITINSKKITPKQALITDLQKEATKMRHLTAKQAAEIAKKAKVKQLYLVHTSQRYKSAKLLVDEAKKVFKNTKEAKDFMKIEI